MSLRFPISRLSCLLLAALLTGCGDLPDARSAWVCNALAEDNEVMLGRDAGRVEAKLQSMTADPYLWFRGTAGLFYREVVQPSNGWVFAGTASAEASDVQLVGDAHIENIGTYLDESGMLRAEFNDFDGAGFGAFWVEVWRLATSFALLDRAGLAAGSPEVGRVWAGWVAEGYAEGALSEAERALRPVVDNGEGGPLLADLFSKAREKGGERDELADETFVSSGERKFRYAALPERQPLNADLLIEPSTAERALAEHIYRSLLSSEAPTPGALLGVARRQGAGIASMPNLRLYLLLDGVTEGREDDVILEAKELLDPPIWLDPRRGDNWSASEQGERVVQAQLALQGQPRADRWLGSFRDGQMAFRIRHYTDFQAELDHEDVGALARSGAAARLLAQTAGRLLARSHMQAPLRGGGDAMQVIQSAITGRREAFVEQVQEVAVAMSLRTVADLERFREAGAIEDCVSPWRKP